MKTNHLPTKLIKVTTIEHLRTAYKTISPLGMFISHFGIAARRRHFTMKTANTVEARIVRARDQFRRSCDQIFHLNLALIGLTRRYKKAKTENHRTFRYPLRLKLAVVEGVRNMYYDYAKLKAEEIQCLQDELQGQLISVDDASDSVSG